MAGIYNADLVVILSAYRDGIRYVNRSDFEPLGLTAEAIREQALANVRRMIGEINVIGRDGCYLLGAGGTFDSSLLQLDEVLENPRLQISGKALIAISDRGSFWVAVDANPQAMFNVVAGVGRCRRSIAPRCSLDIPTGPIGPWPGTTTVCSPDSSMFVLAARIIPSILPPAT